ncbi:unnamed protein product [Ostreobium quekettii]|uniref:Sec1-like protein n=1 Tax=Ostreobium quekettii TaxID=121088 RepID=A0A8S1J1Z7_9CHLO|nr:unnamed protein product [Ostreobium quekettii]
MALEAVYFICPTPGSIGALMGDFSDAKSVYTGAHVFFTSKLATEFLNRIKGNRALVQRLKALKEANLEVLTVDSRSFQTGQPEAMTCLFGSRSDERSREFSIEVDSMATRLATVFAALKEYPSIRYRKTGDRSLGNCAIVPERLAQSVQMELLNLLQKDTLPSKPSCDLLIVDRGFDPVAPIIHEWTYEAMVYDLEHLDGDVFMGLSGSKSEKKEVVLGEHDELWVEIRHMHIAQASRAVNERMEDFRKRNEAARRGGDMGSGMSASDMRKLIQALPEFRDVLSKVALHIDISHDLFQLVEERNLKTLGEVEQDLVYGDKHSKDVITWLSENQQASVRDKMRLFMCYLATHPDKLDSERRVQWQKLAGLHTEDMSTVLNLEYLGVPVSKKDAGSSRLLNFGRRKKRATRKERGESEQEFALARFQPLLAEVLEDLVSGSLPADQYPYINPPEGGQAPSSKVTSVRTQTGWAQRAKGTQASSETGQNKRIVVFVIGGFTRSEMRAVHKLSSSLSKDIILGGTSVETPDTFIQHLSDLGHARQDDLAVQIEGSRY